uniref:Granzyme A-like n=1 Tax=Dromaius novaehollandiae TaxID=8790 RepID=A0A8C4KKP3_DRONO
MSCYFHLPRNIDKTQVLDSELTPLVPLVNYLLYFLLTEVSYSIILCLLLILQLLNGCTDIIGGHPVLPHSWPFMAKWVLTAAHCKLRKLEIRVVLGAHRASTAEKKQQIFRVMHYFPNPQFNRSSKENYIMLLKLNDTANLNKYVQLLPLPDSVEDIKPDRKCKVAGWGVTSSGKPSPCLQETAVTIFDRRSCKSKYKKHMKITINMLRAGGKNIFSKRDACQGDSGGPLICASRCRRVVSFGKGCGKRRMPGVYT